MTRCVRFRVLDGVAVVTLDAPPLNVLTADMRGGLWASFQKIEDSPEIKAAVLTASAEQFSIGADIEELDGGASPPELRQVCDLIEGTSKPVVAALNGPALGGGAELALSCHYRVALATGQIEFPEVAVGGVPCAGGTQRLPRLIGTERALQMIITTRSIDPSVGLRMGLVDGLIDGDVAAGAVRFAQTLIEGGQGPRPTRANRTHLADGKAHLAAIHKARAALAANPLHAPQQVIDCVEAAGLLPFEAGIALEADAFEQCMAHPQSVALRHVYKAERNIDGALVEADGDAFRPVAPMGKAVVIRLAQTLRGAAEFMVDAGGSQSEVDGAMVAYGFRRGPFGGREAGEASPDIVRRLVGALVAEGGACVAQGAVQRPSDIDVLAVHGMGYPRRMGGPMRAAQTEGLIGLRRNMRVWSQDSDLWAVPDVMNEAIKLAAGFDGIA